MIKLNYNLNACCKNCRTAIPVEIFKDDFSEFRNERSMGYEIEYEYKKDIKCPKCNNDIMLGFHVYEYPNDWINFSEAFGYGYFKDDVIEKINNINEKTNNVLFDVDKELND